ncbi:unnamed protein product [Cylicocyclus nassatus]|uniref:Anion exchange protein n=1 Tax=Cylicocyclus nassatus TaxID=53992 RepID=A0AA36H216_CYLNA|nr:unnamed protein product [Cylicocyclus nassatus]
MPARSLSLAGIPELRGSAAASRYRKSSVTDPVRRPSISSKIGQESDLLLDPITVSQIVNLGNHIDSPVENVRRLVLLHPEDDPLVFTEMMTLEESEDGEIWKQSTRWIKYEQMVEGGFTRFSKPHISLLHMQAMMQARNCFKKGVVLLDDESTGYDCIVDVVVKEWVKRGLVRGVATNAIRDILMAPKQHLGAVPGKNYFEDSTEHHARLVRDESSGGAKYVENGEAMKDDDSTEEQPDIKPLLDIIKANRRTMKRMPTNIEGAAILVGRVVQLERAASAFVRLKYPQKLYPTIPDLPVPIRFLFILLSPKENYEKERISIGRTIGSLLSDEIFRKVALHTLEPFTIADAADEFISQIVAVPPGVCSTETRWEPRETETKQTRSVGMLYATYRDHEVEDEEVEEVHGGGIVRTGKLFGGLWQDIKTKAPWFMSDFVDFFGGRLSQSLAATIFLFFANITSIITFGAVMERMLHHQMASIEAILSGGISGMIFALFSGQPLNILSATGPTLVFENILFDFCIGNGWEFLPFRCWVGIWIAFILLVLTATDMSALVGLISRFTEEAFATLISVIFIIQSLEKLMEISHDAPIVTDPREVFESPCFCHINELDPTKNATVTLRLKDITAEECAAKGGEAVGLQCHFKPDVYMLSVLLTFGTFALAYGLDRFRNSKYLLSTLRNAISDFGVVIAIVVMTAFSHFIGLDVPSLNVPESFKPTIDRPWLIDITRASPIVAVVAFFPAAFYTILIVMDQQITAVIINRKDNLLRKGEGYHLDLFVIAILVLICSFLGLPFYVAATVLSVMHVNSLRLQSETSAPGEIPRFLGVNEQRLSGFLAHFLIGLSVFLTGVIKLVPLPVLIGIFLYMGVVSLLGQQFVQRIGLLFMSVKNQPDYVWLRTVRMRRVHLFTVIQLLSIGALFAIKYTKYISMMFPLMLVVMVLLRMFVLEKIFTQVELSALDDMLPSFKQVVNPRRNRRKNKEMVDLLAKK